MKTRSHKKYRKRGIRKSRRNKVGGSSSLIETITNAFGLTTPQVPQQVLEQPVVQKDNQYFQGQVNKKKENMLQKVGGRRTRKYKK